jgi:hypothetical protein
MSRTREKVRVKQTGSAVERARSRGWGLDTAAARPPEEDVEREGGGR